MGVCVCAREERKHNLASTRERKRAGGSCNTLKREEVNARTNPSLRGGGGECLLLTCFQSQRNTTTTTATTRQGKHEVRS